MSARQLASILTAVSLALAAPDDFPVSGNGLWYTNPGTIWSRQYLPVGNGYLAAMTPGGSSIDITQLNIESLWSGGPFEDPSYNGGNKHPSEQAETTEILKNIQQAIFKDPEGQVGDISALTTEAGAYGSYAGAGYIINSVAASGDVSNYARWLDLDEGIAHTTWTQDDISFTRSLFCSHPSKACVQHIASADGDATLPDLTYAFSSALETGLPTPNITCLDNSTLSVRGNVGSPGMLYEFLFRAYSTGGAVSCTPVLDDTVGAIPNATLSITPSTESFITWIGDTEFSLDPGPDFSFRGPDPHEALLSILPSELLTYSDILEEHLADYKSTFTAPFSLSLGQIPNLDTPTDVLKDSYEVDVGNTYLEWLTFNFGRYLLWASARGKLPANLQGKWAKDIGNPWSADYHSNINIQMNYWVAEITNLDVTKSLFDYFEKNWVPRGEQTVQVLYNISRGWVVHNEMNIFGHTGMKGPGNTALWANYPEANAWMMFHVYDHFDHTNDIEWWRSQGWPLLKGAAAFHLDKLIPDLHFNDSTLVVNPCNSPEQDPITFGCAHSQQMIWQLFNAVEKGFEASGDTDIAFLEEVISKREQMDKGLHIGSWGQLQEWKIEKDRPEDTHRHISHLIGLYPGYAISNYDSALQETNHTKEEILEAAKVSLIHRGAGTGDDADAGWAKAWRAASWAQLGNATEFYHLLTYTIERNLGVNLFSLYDPFETEPIFQIDANLGYPGALMNALIQAPDVPSLSTPVAIKILPALPAEQWPEGSIRSARVRGGITVDVEWSAGVPTKVHLVVDKDVVVPRPVEIWYGGKMLELFTTDPGLTLTIEEF